MISIIAIDEKPITLMGRVAGICYGKPTDGSDPDSDYKRGLDCIKSGHGRVLEYPSITVRIDGYSARAIRELYTHIIGTSRLQESTRYIDMGDFQYFTPPSIKANLNALKKYNTLMECVTNTYNALLDLDIPKEDVANVLPMAYLSSIVLKINVRALLHLGDERLCSRAYHEIFGLVYELKKLLVNLDDDEWHTIGDMMLPKCERLGYCPEKKSCGRALNEEMFKSMLNNIYGSKPDYSQIEKINEFLLKDSE